MGKRFLRGGVITRKIQFPHTYQDIISVENLLLAWKEFLKGKRKKADVQEFQFNLMGNILELHQNLKQKTYRHGGYQHFKVNDPKPRDIHKASVRDRLLHHALYRQLYSFFERTFIADSYSCRLGKGTHKAMNRFRQFAYQVSKNHTRTCFVLKCDIRKFFASIDQPILLEILSSYIPNLDILSLLAEIVGSFHSSKPGKGLPLGNLTSQLLTNIYMNEFDQFVKHQLKVKHYLRYADDFIILLHQEGQLIEIVRYIALFLRKQLKLELHPDKVFIQTFASGVDFLGWVHFKDHRVLRTASRRRMFRRVLSPSAKLESLQSYLGLLSHGNANKLQRTIEVLINRK